MTENEKGPVNDGQKRLSKFKRSSIFLNPFAHLATLDDSRLNVAIEILQKPIRQRTQTNSQELLEILFKFDFFQNLIASGETETALNCCSYLEYFRLEKGQILFNEGDSGDNFYIVLRGEVQLSQKVGSMVQAQKVANFTQDKKKAEIDNLESDLQILNAKNGKKNNLFKSNADESKKKKFNQADDKGLKKESDKTQKDENKNSEQPQEEQEQEKEKLLTKIRAGQSFGEIALITKTKRGASAYALDAVTHLAVLKKQYFDRILSTSQDKALRKKLTFLNSMKIFESWGFFLLNKLYFHLESTKISWQRDLYKEGEPANKVYIIKSGKFTIFRAYNYQEDKNHKMNIKSSQYKKKNIRLCIISEGEMIGEEDLINSANYSTTAVCSSQEADVYSLNKESFMTIVYGNYDAKTYLDTHIISKKKLYEERFRESIKILRQKKNFILPTKDPAFQNKVFHEMDFFTKINAELTNEQSFIKESEQTFDKVSERFETIPEEIHDNSYQSESLKKKFSLPNLGSNFEKKLDEHSQNHLVSLNSILMSPIGKDLNDQNSKNAKVSPTKEALSSRREMSTINKSLNARSKVEDTKPQELSLSPSKIQSNRNKVINSEYKEIRSSSVDPSELRKLQNYNTRSNKKILPLKYTDSKFLPKIGKDSIDIESFSKAGIHNPVPFKKLIQSMEHQSKVPALVEAENKIARQLSLPPKRNFSEHIEKQSLEQNLSYAHPKVRMLYFLRENMNSNAKDVERIRRYIHFTNKTDKFTEFKNETDEPQIIYGKKSFFDTKEEMDIMQRQKKRLLEKLLKVQNLDDLKNQNQKLDEAITSIFESDEGINSSRKQQSYNYKSITQRTRTLPNEEGNNDSQNHLPASIKNLFKKSRAISTEHIS